MTNKERENVLAMARHEYSDYSIDKLRAEFKRKLLLKELDMFGYVLTPGELTALFQILIEERKNER